MAERFAAGWTGGGVQLNFIIEELRKAGFDVDRAVQVLNNNGLDHSIGRCAKYVRWALEGGGINTAGHPVCGSRLRYFSKKKRLWDNKLYRLHSC